MTTYTAIPDASLEPGKPARSVDAILLRDNPIAITEGASGAPRNAPASLVDLLAGNNYITYNTDSVSISTSTNTKAFEYVMPRGGTVRAKTVVSSATGGAIARVYVNGVAIGATHLPTGPATYTDDIAVAAGDLVQLYLRYTIAASFYIGVDQSSQYQFARNL